MKKKLIFSQQEPLHSLDSESQTYGCRQTNPEICKFNSVPNICAFVTEDNVCRHPSRAWAKKYLELRSMDN
jgi:hypothetical protein